MKPASWSLEQPDWAAIDAIAAGKIIRVDSRQIGPGEVFLAFQGEYADGRDFIANAIERGAAAVIWEDADGFAWNPQWSVTHLGVPHLRAQAGILAAHLLGNPGAKMQVTGITGTNGKTSISHWLAQAWALLGQRCGILGTIGNGFPGALATTTHTTLDPLGVQNWLAKLQLDGATHVAMEVSSHGLEQARVHGVPFHTAVFTNLTRDHLDYHGTMEAYGAAKLRLFEWEGLQNAVINVDDTFGQTLVEKTSAARVLTYGLTEGDVHATRLIQSLAGLRIHVTTPQGKGILKSPLIGRFNASNLLACLAVLLGQDVPLAEAIRVLGKIEAAPGRMQRLGGKGLPLVVVDYAHTPDALEKALVAVRDIMPDDSRLFCIFGCGGHRDRGKRPLMAQIACRLADSVIITSDNPRDEEPQAIIEDIVSGVNGVPGTGFDDYTIESDRAIAIADAIELAGLNDVVLIAGKGHETYQEIKGERRPFDDCAVAAAALARKKSA